MQSAGPFAGAYIQAFPFRLVANTHERTVPYGGSPPLRMTILEV